MFKFLYVCGTRGGKLQGEFIFTSGIIPPISLIILRNSYESVAMDFDIQLDI